MSSSHEEQVVQQQPTIWQQNHGNFLLVWIAIIFIVGSVILWFRAGLEPQRIMPEQFGLPDQPAEPTLIVRIVGKEDLTDGPVKISVYNTADTFKDPSKASLKDTVTHKDGFAVWLIPLKLLPAKFGIAVYHDGDGNGELTKNQLGMPVEPFGFSRNQRGLFGSPPAYEQTLIEKPIETYQTEIRIR